ncbi:MAG: hypothetical protein ACC657_16425 [Thiohalomonadales bacterium]
MNRLNTKIMTIVITSALLVMSPIASAEHLISVETKPSEIVRFTYVKVFLENDLIKVTGKLKLIDENKLEEFGSVMLELLDDKGIVLKSVNAKNDNGNHRFKTTYLFSKRFSEKPFHAATLRLSHYFQP